ncbi:DUF5133 domain-containing protein [Streptomyces sp. HUAS 31]|nr:DUF5133 domain-containing protein [Streptomyces sp. HUAS 31]WCE01829.1 DUF5133 domain-containing protein [Streptomyces sp. HUAS 31]
MILPAERELRAALARFASARIDHDVRPTGATSRALEDATYTLCVMTSSRSLDEALVAADALLQRYRSDRAAVSREVLAVVDVPRSVAPAEAASDTSRLESAGA